MPPKLLFGGAGIGTTEKSYTYTFDTPEKVSELLSVLMRLDIMEIDSAASYPTGNPWNTETLLGQSMAVQKGFIIDSKIDWTVGGRFLNHSNIERSINRSLKLLRSDKARTIYIHTPDKETPLEDTAAALHRQYIAGKFEQLGICNFDGPMMSKYFKICAEEGYVKPTVYQGFYSVLLRSPTEELIPLLRKHNCAFFAFSPLAGGFMTGKVTHAVDSGDESGLERARWRGESAFQSYVRTFDKPGMHNAIRNAKRVCEAASPAVSLQEAALRWLMHHSALRDGDAIILGGKRLDQLEENVLSSRNGPLEGRVLETMEKLCELANRAEAEP